MPILINTTMQKHLLKIKLPLVIVFVFCVLFSSIPSTAWALPLRYNSENKTDEVSVILPPMTEIKPFIPSTLSWSISL